jgi:hypothetical protein
MCARAQHPPPRLQGATKPPMHMARTFNDHEGVARIEVVALFLVRCRIALPLQINHLFEGSNASTRTRQPPIPTRNAPTHVGQDEREHLLPRPQRAVPVAGVRRGESTSGACHSHSGRGLAGHHDRGDRDGPRETVEPHQHAPAQCKARVSLQRPRARATTAAAATAVRSAHHDVLLNEHIALRHFLAAQQSILRAPSTPARPQAT